VIASLLLAACSRGDTVELLLATTTSTEDSGLFGVLLPAFERAHPDIRVRLVAVGSGQALELGRRRDADVLLVHSPPDEDMFMASGFGRTRRPVMHNDFVIVGPAADPAGAAHAPDAEAALRRIAASNTSFVSRGDDSGTHRRELALWAAAGFAAAPSAPARIEVGQGMAETLVLTSERQAYTLADRGTWLALADALQLVVAHEGGTALLNSYSVITVAGARQQQAADRFADWITSADAARVIDAFGVERHGRPLFSSGAR
jgi:tungstate transport system substrate-binding protein